jgi:hypothetical protein
MPFDAMAQSDHQPKALVRCWKNRIITSYGIFHGPLIWPNKESARKRATAVLAVTAPDQGIETMDGILVKRRNVRAIRQVRWR